MSKEIITKRTLDQEIVKSSPDRSIQKSRVNPEEI